MTNKTFQIQTLTLTECKAYLDLQLSGGSDGTHGSVLAGMIGQNLCKADKSPVRRHLSDPNSLTLEWEDAVLTIVHTDLGTDHRRYDLTWAAKNNALTKFIDSFKLQGSHWYGLSQVREQLWPIEKWQQKSQPFVATDNNKDEWGSVQERYVISSQGVAICIHPGVPLFLDFNNNKSGLMTMKTKFSSPYRNPNKDLLFSQYTIFQGGNIRTTHQLLFTSGTIKKPQGVPNEKLFHHPIWTTWVKHKSKIDQHIVSKLGQQIHSHGFKAAYLQLDDGWATSQGDMDFSSKRFPDPKELIAHLGSLGIRVNLWVHPFAANMSKAAKHQRGVWVKSHVGGTTNWWHGVARLLDATNPEARDWFLHSLSILKDKYGVTSFKFCAGEVNWLPNGFKCSMEVMSPNVYTTAWANLAHESDKDVIDKDTGFQDVRVGCHTQNLPIFVRMLSKDSKWGHDNGLRAIIPQVLTFGILGYPYVLPDIIGGNTAHGQLPEKELFIRWLQVSILLPAVQFSHGPWQFGEDVLIITQKMLELRANYADKLLHLAQECCDSGDPIIRPLWWIAPEDESALAIDSEYLVGNDLLVAPILEKGATQRKIYLPRGKWRDELRDAEIDGGKWLPSYSATLEELPHFTLLSAIPGITKQGRSHRLSRLQRSQAVSDES